MTSQRDRITLGLQGALHAVASLLCTIGKETEEVSDGVPILSDEAKAEVRELLDTAIFSVQNAAHIILVSVE